MQQKLLLKMIDEVKHQAGLPVYKECPHLFRSSQWVGKLKGPKLTGMYLYSFILWVGCVLIIRDDLYPISSKLYWNNIFVIVLDTAHDRLKRVLAFQLLYFGP